MRPDPETPRGPPGSVVPATMCKARKRVSNCNTVTIPYGRLGSGRIKVRATRGGSLEVGAGRPSVDQVPSPGSAGVINGLIGTNGITVRPLSEGMGLWTCGIVQGTLGCWPLNWYCTRCVVSETPRNHASTWAVICGPKTARITSANCAPN